MAKLRLFANLREAAGTGRTELPGTTVGEVLDAASAAYGDTFTAGLAVANVWVNGDVADRDTPVSDGDEVALIPPVSGGAQGLTDEATPALLGLILLATFLIANVVNLQALTFAAVGGALAWVWDITDTMAERRIFATAFPALLGATAAGNAAYRWGVPGLAAGVAVGVVLALCWPLFDARYRDLELVGSSALTGLVASLGAGGLILARAESTVNVTAFLVIMLFGAVASWAVRRFLPEVQGLDPNLAAGLGVLIGALVVGFAAESLSPAVALVAGAAAVAGWFAGRVIGSILRSGDVAHTVRGPGLLTAIDGVVLGAAGFWLGLLLFG
jgi:molybdopterin synthase sulfur carrier subunit